MQTTDISKDEFIQQRLGPTVLASALALEASDPQVAAFRFMLDNALPVVSLVNPYTVGGVQMLVSKGIITSDDATRILAPVELPDPIVPIPEPAPDYSGWSVSVGGSAVVGAQVETQVRFTCAADETQSFSQSFLHRDDTDLLPAVRSRVLAAKNPPSALASGAPLVL